MNTRKTAKGPKGVASLNEARKLTKNIPLSSSEIQTQLKKFGFLGGKSKTRKSRRRRFA